MRAGFDFSSWEGVLTTLLGLVVVTLVMVGIRLLVMQTVQKRRERENRQINERLRTLIAAYKTLGGSFTGDLQVDPTHLRDLVKEGREAPGSDRRRRIRDAVEAALSDVILLGTAEQVRLAAAAANDLVAGRPVATSELVVSLRAYIREVLDLEAVVPVIPRQGPARPGGSSGRSGGKGDAGAGRAGAGGGSRGGGAGGGGMAVGGMGLGAAAATDEPER
jgi:heme exporter protein D